MFATNKVSNSNLRPHCATFGAHVSVFGVLMAALALIPAMALGEQHRASQNIQNPTDRNAHRGHAHRPGFFERLRDMPPNEQQRVMANDDRFHKLPPTEQRQIRQNLRRWNGLSSQRRQQLRQREQVFSQLRPAQRQDARSVFQQWRQLHGGQQEQVRRAFRQMRGMTPEQRQQFLSSSQVHDRFSQHEQNILRGLNELLPKQ